MILFFILSTIAFIVFIEYIYVSSKMYDVTHCIANKKLCIHFSFAIVKNTILKIFKCIFNCEYLQLTICVVAIISRIEPEVCPRL